MTRPARIRLQTALVRDILLNGSCLLITACTGVVSLARSNLTLRFRRWIRPGGLFMVAARVRAGAAQKAISVRTRHVLFSSKNWKMYRKVTLFGNFENFAFFFVA